MYQPMWFFKYWRDEKTPYLPPLLFNLPPWCLFLHIKNCIFYWKLIISCSVPPYIHSWERTLEVTAGDDLTIICEATGNPAPTISWRKYETGKHLSSDSSQPDRILIANITRWVIKEGVMTGEVTTPWCVSDLMAGSTSARLTTGWRNLWREKLGFSSDVSRPTAVFPFPANNKPTNERIIYQVAQRYCDILARK